MTRPTGPSTSQAQRAATNGITGEAARFLALATLAIEQARREAAK